jgi:hypothetical protein
MDRLFNLKCGQAGLVASHNEPCFQASRPMNALNLKLVEPNILRIIDGDPVIEAGIRTQNSK